MIRYGQTTAKVRCSYCEFPVYPGNRERHERACLRRIERRRRRQFIQDLTNGDPRPSSGPIRAEQLPPGDHHDTSSDSSGLGLANTSAQSLYKVKRDRRTDGLT